jgi:hypothetical protein
MPHAAGASSDSRIEFRTMRHPILAARLIQIKNHQLSWWFDGEPLKAVLKDSATFGMGLWDH